MKIIVSLTSWKKRIEKIDVTLNSILHQTLLPDSIELNLSLEEFPNKEKDLPEKIQSFLNEHKNMINCNWCEGNTRTFKKIIPTLKKYVNEDTYYIVSIDDDFIYREDYIQLMVNYIKEYDADSFCMANSKVIGNRTIYKSSAFENDFHEKLTQEIISYGIDDGYTEYYLACKKRKMSNYRPDDVKEIIIVHDEDFPLHDEYKQGDRIKQAGIAIRKVKFT